MDHKKSLRCPMLHVVQGTASSLGEMGQVDQKGENKAQFGEVPALQGAKQPLADALGDRRPWACLNDNGHV